MKERLIVILGLKRKQREIQGAIASYDAQIAQAKHDLSHINAAIKILEGSDASKRAYLAGRGFFDKGEIAGIAVRCLERRPSNRNRGLAALADSDSLA